MQVTMTLIEPPISRGGVLSARGRLEEKSKASDVVQSTAFTCAEEVYLELSPIRVVTILWKGT